MAAENQKALHFRAPEEGTYLPFLTELFGKASAPELAEALEESGATVTNISESEGTIDENGKFQKYVYKVLEALPKLSAALI